MITLIAEHADDETVLSLSAASKRLREICFQPSVFRKQILTTQMIYPLRAEPASSHAYLDRLNQLPNMTPGHWARFAKLDRLVRFMITKERVDDQHVLLLKLHSNVNWLSRHQSEIIANGHPCLESHRFWLLSKWVFHQWGLDSSLPGSLGLFAVAWTLSDRRNVICANQVGFFIEIYVRSSGFWLEPGQTHWTPVDAEVWSMLVCLSRTIDDSRATARDLGLPAPPSFSEIQIPDGWRAKCSRGVSTDRTVVPTNAQKGSFVTQFLSKATKRKRDYTTEGPRHLYDQIVVPDAIAFMISGSWAGYYTYAANGRFMGFRPFRDAPMRYIRFHIIKEMQNSVQVEALNALDGVGTFDMRLEVSKQDGRFRGEKWYNGPMNFHSWEWIGMVTPFGIFAAWGELGSLGYVWLWKEN